jgi:hypothetical protein
MMVSRRIVFVAFDVVFAVAVEVYLYLSYTAHEARSHWFTHFFLGASAALLVMATVVGVGRRPFRLPLLAIVLGHLFAMVPDVLFAFGIRHDGWMDVFLAHVSSHVVPGGNATWFVVFLGSLGAYLAVYLRHVRKRTADA